MKLFANAKDPAGLHYGATNLQNILFILDMFHLLQSYNVVNGEDFQCKVVAAFCIPAQTHTGEGT